MSLAGVNRSSPLIIAGEFGDLLERIGDDNNIAGHEPGVPAAERLLTR
jgi:hypothetical protein